MKHELHLARLEYELEQRKKLSELCNTFEEQKKELAAGNLLDILGIFLFIVYIYRYH